MTKKTANEIITEICYTLDHSYGLEPDGIFYTQAHKEGIRRQAEQIFSHNVKPLLDELGYFD